MSSPYVGINVGSCAENVRKIKTLPGKHRNTDLPDKVNEKPCCDKNFLKKD
jgi:hypothetical protein